MKRLRDNLNSQYIEAANRLKPANAPLRVVAYVESYDDVPFWRTVLGEFETDKLRFEVMLPSRKTLGKGKKYVLTNELGKQLGGYMIACVDADYDYLMQRHSDSSCAMLDNPYVFHTYVYAIENYFCYAPGLREACVAATLNDREIVNLTAFMQEYSKTVWPLFVWNVWGYRSGRTHRFSLIDIFNIIGISKINIYHLDKTLEFVRRQVNRSIAALQRRYPEAKKTYAPLKEELLRIGITPDTTYLYLQGHSLVSSVVLPLLEPVCAILRKERESEIRQLACHDTQRQNELSCYHHTQQPIDLALKKGTAFKRSEPYHLLMADLQKFVDNL